MASRLSFLMDMIARSLRMSWLIVLLSHVCRRHNALKERSQLLLLTELARATCRKAFRVGNMSSSSMWNTMAMSGSFSFTLETCFPFSFSSFLLMIFFSNHKLFWLQWDLVMGSKVLEGIFRVKGRRSWVAGLIAWHELFPYIWKTMSKLLQYPVKTWIKKIAVLYWAALPKSTFSPCRYRWSSSVIPRTLENTTSL